MNDILFGSRLFSPLNSFANDLFREKPVRPDGGAVGGVGQSSCREYSGASCSLNLSISDLSTPFRFQGLLH